MRPREQGPTAVPDAADHLVFGPSDDVEAPAGYPAGPQVPGPGSPGGYGPPDGYGPDGYGPPGSPVPPGGRHGSPGRRRRARGRRRWVLAVLAIIAVAIGAGAYFVGVPVYHYFHPADYTGGGTGSVTAVVHSGDTSTDIAATLVRAGVVDSAKAFTNAAAANPQSQTIQPGVYRLRSHMSAAAALALLLTPSSRLDSDFVIPEGATLPDVEKRLIAPRCTPQSAIGAVCGLGASAADVRSALSRVGALGVPTDYTSGGRAPSTAEGFLYPATYTFDDGVSVRSALQQMVAAFADEVRTANITARARDLHITPYQLLTVASIAQAEAKFPQDMPKVARVILNRLAANMPLQVDATSAYAAKLRGLDPAGITYATIGSKYNTYQHSGLPPTPIGNPGATALLAAAHPADGNWIYYVNGDAAGHLFFTHDADAFDRAAQICHRNGWGCG